nr:MAG TPA: hypothetical protein [Caudoviricetes sp.]
MYIKEKKYRFYAGLGRYIRLLHSVTFQKNVTSQIFDILECNDRM